MAKQITITVMPNRQADKRSCVASQAVGAVLPAAPDNCVIYLGDDVAMHRKVEIHEGLRWLWNGIRDRDLLNPATSQPGFGPLYSAAPVNRLVEEFRLTSWTDVSGINSTMIAIGIGNNLFGEGATNMHESAFTMLREYLTELKSEFPAP